MAFKQWLAASPKMMTTKIEKWMREVITSRDYRRFSDLHIDVLDESLRSPDNWVTGGYQCLRAALLIRNVLKVDFTIAMAISLASSPIPRGVNFDSHSELREEMDESPPSLYVCERDSLPWTAAGRLFELGHAFQLTGDLPTQAFLNEWWHEEDGEFRRTVWIAG